MTWIAALPLTTVDTVLTPMTHHARVNSVATLTAEIEDQNADVADVAAVRKVQVLPSLATPIAVATVTAVATTIETPTASYVNDLRQGLFDVTLMGTELAPGWDVLPMWHSSQTDGRGLNVSRIADAKLDVLLEALVSEFDPAQVPKRAASVESRLLELRPAQPLFTDMTDMVVRLARFPGLRELDPVRGITLRELLPAVTAQARPAVKLKMLAPK